MPHVSPSRVSKTVIVPHTPEKMFRLVDDIENYSRYLPWCTSSSVKHRNATEVIGVVYLEYLKVKVHFGTKNINTPYSKIDFFLVEGPFKELSGTWCFTPLGDHGCRINFELEYKFSNYLLEKIIDPVFNYISKNIVDCFIKEANKQYGLNHG